MAIGPGSVGQCEELTANIVEPASLPIKPRLCGFALFPGGILPRVFSFVCRLSQIVFFRACLRPFASARVLSRPHDMTNGAAGQSFSLNPMR